jgi:hypothetical protein
VGLTGRQFRARLAEHKQYVRSKNMDKHSEFHQQCHDVSQLGGLVLEHVKSNDPFILCKEEYLYIYTSLGMALTRIPECGTAHP